LAASKNVGHNKWFNSNSGSYDSIEDYLRLIQLRAANVWLKKYWDVSLKLQAKENFDALTSVVDINTQNNDLNFSTVSYSNFDESLR